jgi:hypothetical protein
MATLRQKQANRLNGLRNRGATTAEGRMASAANGRTHGLSASKCLRDDERERIAERTAELEERLKPEGAEPKEHVAEIAAADVRIEMCDLDEENWRYQRAQRAEYYWEEDRRAEAEKLFARIDRKPAQTVRALRQSLHGARRLHAAFTALAGRITCPAAGEPPRPLDEAGRERCFDLMGIDCDERQGQGASPLDLQGGQTGDDAALAAHQAAVIAAQIAELEKLTSERFQELDEQNRLETVLGNFPGIDQQTRLIRRYRTEAERRRDRHRAELHRLQEEAARAREMAAEDAMDRQAAEAWAREEADEEPVDAPPPPVAEARTTASSSPIRTDAPHPSAAPNFATHRRLSRHERKAMARRAALANR